MKFASMLAAISYPAFANDNDAFIPEIWAQESLMILENNMVAANLVHRDFENQIAQFGDVVNTRRPSEFEAVRKTDTDAISVQDAISQNVAVPLNQHIHTSFIIKDGEETKGFQVLRDVYLEPAMLSIAQMIDEVVLGEAYQFLTLDNGAPNVVGQLGVAATKQTLIAVREQLNVNKCPQIGRNLIVCPSTEADLLAVDALISAEQVGDAGTALREASLGRRFGILHWMSQNTPNPIGTQIRAVGAVNLVAGYAAGTVTMTVDGLVAALVAGEYFVVAGDNTPQRVISSVGGATPTSVTFFPGLVNAVLNDAVITFTKSAAINLVAGYVSGYAKSLVIDGLTTAPKAGQLVTFQAGAGIKDNFSSVLTLDAPTTTKVSPNKPLSLALVDDDVVGMGPPGAYNLALHRNALALVTRPLAAPAAGTGALSFVASFNGLSMRVTITYDGTNQGHLVTCDMLLGVKVLDRRLGCVMLG